ncbi:MAG: metallophosphoesterase [Clostridiaceae bacterium]
MLVAVVSDTHHAEKYIKKIREVIKNADIFIHLGDNVVDSEEISKGFKGKVFSVRGNCDFETKVPREEIIQIEDKRFLLTHGDKYQVKYDNRLLNYAAMENDVDAVLYGHTHIPGIEEIDGRYFINPGSPSLPRGNKRTIAFIEIEKGKPLYSYIYEIL